MEALHEFMLELVSCGLSVVFSGIVGEAQVTLTLALYRAQLFLKLPFFVSSLSRRYTSFHARAGFSWVMGAFCLHFL
jgi:hypothetical protein